MAYTLQQVIEQVIEGKLYYDDFSIQSYSGRGMYGKQCLSVHCDPSPGKLKIAIIEQVHSILNQDVQESETNEEIEAHIEACTELLKQMMDAREDSMGLGTVIYWPDIPFVADES